MMEHQPGLILLFASALFILWLTPLSAWWMLSGETNPAARIWFTGTTFYALVATIFIFGASLPVFLTGPVNSALSVISVLCLFEAMRREISDRPPPYWLYAAIVVADVVIMTAALLLQQGRTYGVALHLTIISLIECAILVLIIHVHRRERSRALWLIFSVLSLFILSNMTRVFQFAVTGHMSTLLDFSVQSNAAIIINFCSVVFYCYGYWGFVVEKNRRQKIRALEAASAAREDAADAHYREQLAATLHEQKTAFLDRLTRVERQSRSAALAASIAHEINQPLAAMAINVAEARRIIEADEAHHSLQRFIERIEFDQVRIAGIIARLRSMFSEVPLQPQASNLDDVVRNVVTVSDHLHHPDIKLVLKLNAPEPFYFSSSEIEHVLNNLLRNAQEAVLASSSEDKAIIVETWVSEDRVHLSVSDNGDGISPDIRPKLFNLMESTKRDGMGLGLWLSRFIVERHGGTLRHDDTPSSGARFVFELPNTQPNE